MWSQQLSMIGLSCRCRFCRCNTWLPYKTLRPPVIMMLSGLSCSNKGTLSRSCDLRVFQMVGRRSFAAPSGGARRPASPWRWGTEWHGRAARTRLMAAPTQTALMECAYPTCSPPNQILFFVFLNNFSLFCVLLFRFVFPTPRLGLESQFSDFLDGLGPAQIVGRQTLATPPMGKPRLEINNASGSSLIHHSLVQYCLFLSRPGWYSWKP